MSGSIETQAAQDIYFNPWDENFRANPYPHYRPLLAGPPRIIDMGFKFVLAARYADVRAILMDHATFSSVQPAGMGFDEQTKVFGDAPTMLGSDPRHRRGCAGWSRATSPRAESANWNRASARSPKI